MDRALEGWRVGGRSEKGQYTSNRERQARVKTVTPPRSVKRCGAVTSVETRPA